MYWTLPSRTRTQVLSAIGRWAVQHPLTPSSHQFRPLSTSCLLLIVPSSRQRISPTGGSGAWRTSNVIIPPSPLYLLGGYRQRYQHKGGYSNFGHKPIPPATLTIKVLAFILFCMIGCMIDWE